MIADNNLRVVLFSFILFILFIQFLPFTTQAQPPPPPPPQKKIERRNEKMHVFIAISLFFILLPGLSDSVLHMFFS